MLYDSKENKSSEFNAQIRLTILNESSINLIPEANIFAAKKEQILQRGRIRLKNQAIRSIGTKRKQKDDISNRYKGESGKDAAKRVRQKLGEYNSKDTEPGSFFNQ